MKSRGYGPYGPFCPIIKCNVHLEIVTLPCWREGGAVKSFPQGPKSTPLGRVKRPNLETLNIARGHRPRAILINFTQGHMPRVILRVSKLGQVTRWVKRRGPRGVDWGLRGMDFLANLPTWSRVQTISPKLEGLRLNWGENIATAGI